MQETAAEPNFRFQQDLLPRAVCANAAEATSHGMGAALAGAGREVGRGHGELRRRGKKAPRCKVCRHEFNPMSTTQVVCGLACAIRHAEDGAKKREAQQRKTERAQDRKRKQGLKTRRDYLKEAQAAFNAYIRERDAGKPCICCGKSLTAGDIGGKFDCGHYRSVGSAPHLRFDERNAHGQRKQCNRWGAGRAVDYRLGLIARIGLQAVERLEADQAERHWSMQDLIEIQDFYRRKRRELAARNAEVSA